MFKCRVKAKWKAKKLENLCGKVRRSKSHDIASCCGAAHCTLHKTSSFWIRANTFVTQNIKWVFLFSFILGKGQRQQCWKYCNIGPCRLQVSIGMVSIGFVVKKIGTKQALTTLSISSLSFHFLFIFSFSLHFLAARLPQFVQPWLMTTLEIQHNNMKLTNKVTYWWFKYKSFYFIPMSLWNCNYQSNWFVDILMS